MIHVLILGILAITFAWLEGIGKFKHGLKAAFGIIFLFLALRYNYGNDYMSYLSGFIEINKYDEIDYFDKYFRMEIGWIFLNRLFGSLGFFAMIAFLALISCTIYFRFIKKYVEKKYYWIAVFFYIFNPGLMLVHSSAMRQSIAIMIFVFSLDFLFKRKPLQYFLFVGIASIFHTSALVLIPIYLLGYLNWKLNKAAFALIISVFVSLFLFGSELLLYINNLVSTFFEEYKAYQLAGEVGTGIGVIYSIIILLLTIYYERYQNKETSLVFKLAIIGFMFIPLSLLIQMIGRVGMYFQPAMIVVYPILYMSIRKPEVKLVFLLLLLFMTTYSYIQFFSSEIWKDAFGTYQTIFSAPGIF